MCLMARFGLREKLRGSGGNDHEKMVSYTEAEDEGIRTESKVHRGQAV